MEDRTYHLERFEHERAAAARSASAEARQAHERLAALHLDKVERMRRTSSGR